MISNLIGHLDNRYLSKDESLKKTIPMLDGIEDFVIIDDFPYEFEKIFPVHFVQTKSGKGLTYKECEFCINKFNH